MVQHDEIALRNYISWAFGAIENLMAAMSNVEIVGAGRRFVTPPGPIIHDGFYELADELLDPELPVERLLEHAIGLEAALQKLRVMADWWIGNVQQHCAGLNARRSWAAEITAISATTTATLMSRRVADGLSADPGVVRALVLDAPNGPPVLSVLTGTKRAA